MAEQNDELLGYAYIGPFVGRAAYGWSAEVSIYLKETKRKMGIDYKFGRWYDMIWMEKLIGEHSDTPLPVTAFPTLKHLV